MTRTHFLVALLALGMAVGCKVKPAPPQPVAPPPQPAALTSQSSAHASPDLSLNRRIDIMVRSQYNVPMDYTITIGARKPSQIPGYDALPITLTHGGNAQALDFLISTDNQTLARLNTYNLAEYPLFRVAGRPIRGNPAAGVTVINFDDLQCPYCAQMHQTLFPATLERYKDKVRFIYRDNPLVEIHPWALHAAVDANCLAAQSGEVYWAYVDYIHAHSQEVNGTERNPAKSFDALNRIARQQAALGKLDAARLDECLARQDESQVRASMKDAESLGVEGAPALFVNGARVSGAIPEARLWLMIDRALRAVGVEPPAAPVPPAPSQPAGTGK